MAGTTPIYGIPYPESSDLVANYPALGEGLADKLEDKLPTYAGTAPTSPSVGQVWIDSSGSPIGKVWDGSAWTIFSGAGAANFSDTATGTYTDGGIDYKYLTMTATGTVTITTAGFADVLVVGGGGGGTWAGGGAGGCFESTNVYLSAGTQTVVIGAGGPSTSSSPLNGITSRIGPYYGVGGGAANFSGAVPHQGSPGGSGGGAFSSGSDAVGGAGTSGQGNAGGNYTNGHGGAGGGGGATAAGGNSASTAGGDGGAGLASTITGSSVTYAGGGGGAGSSTQGAGGAGGGGTAVASGVANNGTANTGGGAGGNWGYSGTGGAGGSGVVIIRVKV